MKVEGAAPQRTGTFALAGCTAATLPVVKVTANCVALT